MKTLHDLAIEALTSGASVQAEVRDILAKTDETTALVIISTQLAQFRTDVEHIVNSSDDPSSVRKKANNIVNDVSRICREVTGKSIVCTSRKGGNYVYEAKTPTPRATPSPARIVPPVEPVYNKQVSLSDFDAYEVVQHCVSLVPQSVLTEIIRKYGNDKFLEMCREAKDTLDKQA
jgi:hypothetical protein